VCSADNRRHIVGYLPQLEGKIDDDLRAGIDTERYPFVTEGANRTPCFFWEAFGTCRTRRV
jgi:hypothetical protein